MYYILIKLFGSFLLNKIAFIILEICLFFLLYDFKVTVVHPFSVSWVSYRKQSIYLIAYIYIGQTVLATKIPDYKVTCTREFSWNFWLLATFSGNLCRVSCEVTHSAVAKVTEKKLYLPTLYWLSCVLAEMDKTPKKNKTGMIRNDWYCWADGEMIEKAKEKKKKNDEEGDTRRSQRVEGVREHVLLSFCFLIPLDLFCLPFPRSQC